MTMEDREIVLLSKRIREKQPRYIRRSEYLAKKSDSCSCWLQKKRLDTQT